MLEAILMCLGALGVGILFWLWVMLFCPIAWFDDGVVKGLADFLGIAFWVSAVLLYTTFSELFWFWIGLYVVCWALDILAAFSIFVVFGRVDGRQPRKE